MLHTGVNLWLNMNSDQKAYSEETDDNQQNFPTYNYQLSPSNSQVDKTLINSIQRINSFPLSILSEDDNKDENSKNKGFFRKTSKVNNPPTPPLSEFTRDINPAGNAFSQDDSRKGSFLLSQNEKMQIEKERKMFDAGIKQDIKNNFQIKLSNFSSVSSSINAKLFDNQSSSTGRPSLKSMEMAELNNTLSAENDDKPISSQENKRKHWKIVRTAIQVIFLGIAYIKLYIEHA